MEERKSDPAIQQTRLASETWFCLRDHGGSVPSLFAVFALRTDSTDNPVALGLVGCRENECREDEYREKGYQSI